MQNIYLESLVADQLAERGRPGAVHIRPSKPLAERLESGERATFIVEYQGLDTVRLGVSEHEVSCGTRGAPVAVALADLIERACLARSKRLEQRPRGGRAPLEHVAGRARRSRRALASAPRPTHAP